MLTKYTHTNTHTSLVEFHKLLNSPQKHPCIEDTISRNLPFELLTLLEPEFMVTSTAVPYVSRIKKSIISISMKWFRFRAIKTCEKKLIIHFLLMIVFINFFSHTGSLRTRKIYESHWFIPHSDFICQLFSQRTIKNNRVFSAHKNTY